MNCSAGIVIEKMLFKLPAWLKQEFLFPTLPEQQRIADCLASLDDHRRANPKARRPQDPQARPHAAALPRTGGG